MKFTLRDTTYILVLISLSGCSALSSTSTFRNRNLDYTRENVQNLPSLATPSTLNTPPFNPAFTIPPGPNDYPPGNPPTMTPPTFDQEIPIPEETTRASS